MFRKENAVALGGWLLCSLLLIAVLSPNVYLLGAAAAPAYPSVMAATAVVLGELFLLAVLGRPWLWLLLHLPFLIWLPGEWFYLWHYGMPTSAHVFAVIGETNRDETGGWLGSQGWLWIVGDLGWSLLLVATLIFFARRLRPWRHPARRWSALALGAGLVLTLAYLCAGDFATGAKTAAACGGRACTNAAPWTRSRLFGDSYPLGLAIRLYDYHAQRGLLRHDAMALKDADPRLPREPALAALAETYVVVIGESARADHWSLFGYARPTTPRLQRRQQLLAFGDAASVTPTTRTAVPVLLGGASVDDIAAFRFRPSWITAFKAAGFEVSWLSAQLPVGLRDTTVGIYAQLADDVEFLNRGDAGGRDGYDDVLLAALDRRLRSPHRKKLIILHMLGSHAPYQHRYPPAYEIFRPAPGTRDDVGINDLDRGEEIGNAYDNSLRYSDFIVDSVIERLRGSAALTALWYVSDHGQTLPDDGCGTSGNGFFSAFNFHVPLLFWYSASYRSRFGDKLQAAAANTARPVYLADFAASVLDAAGFELPDARRSFMNPAYRAGPRIVTVDGGMRMDYDRDFVASACRN